MKYSAIICLVFILFKANEASQHGETTAASATTDAVTTDHQATSHQASTQGHDVSTHGDSTTDASTAQTATTQDSTSASHTSEATTQDSTSAPQTTEAITCDVPTISQATTDCTASAAFGSTCDVTCNAGYLINGSATITCGDDNSDGIGDYANQPTCGITTCASPTDVWGSTFSCIGNVNYGGTCDLTCDAGFWGARTLNCDQHTAGAATSSWDNDSPCTVITCDVPTISQATTDCTASAAFGSTCDVTCNAGYLISGSATITCWDDNSDGIGDYANQPTCGNVNFSVEDILLHLESLQTTIIPMVSNYYQYEYDGSNGTYMSNGGDEDMYDNGNFVTFTDDENNYQLAEYGATYSYDHHEFGSKVSGPFHAVMWVNNGEGYNDNRNTYNIRVHGESGADGSGSYSVFEGSLENNGYHMKYVVKQVYDAGDPTICEVYYNVWSPEHWGSNEDVHLSFTFSTASTDDLNAVVMLPSDTHKAFLGYLLLSERSNGEGHEIPEEEIRNVLELMLSAYNELESSDHGCPVDLECPVEDDSRINMSPDSIICAQDLCDVINDPNVLFIDVRPCNMIGTVPAINGVNWMNLPLPEMEASFNMTDEEFEQKYHHARPQQDERIVLNCQTSYPASRALDLLRQKGFTNAVHFPGSASRWQCLKQNSNFCPEEINDRKLSDTCEVLPNEPTCVLPLGMENGNIENSQLSASSQYNADTSAQNSRLNADNCWSASTAVENWVQVDFLRPFKVNGIITQGCQSFQEWATLFTVQCSDDGVNFENYMTFVGNSDQNTEVTNMFDDTLTARYFRVVVNEWFGWPSIRMEFLGCASEGLPNAQQLVYVAAHNQHNITNLFDDFHNYYIEQSNEIDDGGDDMYDNGNKVSFKSSGDDSWTRATYGQLYGEQGDYWFSTSTNNLPFIATMWIENEDARHENYSINVQSNSGQDDSNTVTRSSGRFMLYDDTNQTRECQWELVQMFNGEDPSIAELYAAIFYQKHGSTPFTLSLESNMPDDDEFDNTATVSGSPQNMGFAYMLLSNFDGENSREFTDAEIEEAIHRFNNELTQVPDAPSDFTAVGQAMFYLTQFNTKNAIEASVNGYYRYPFDSDYNDTISNANDMYDEGNNVDFNDGNNVDTRAVYGEVYRYDHHEFFSNEQAPFHSIMWIGNGDWAQDRDQYYIKVSGESGADGNGEFSQFHGEMHNDGFHMRYAVKQVFGASDPTICEVFYTIYSPGWWQSSSDVDFSYSFSTSNTNDLSSTASVSVNTRNAFLGYTLLAQSEGQEISESEVRNVLQVIMNQYSNVVPPQSATTAETTHADTTTTQGCDGGCSKLQKVWQSLGYDQSIVSNQIADFYQYQYDGYDNNDINDGGGNDMYDGGNQVYFNSSNTAQKRATYEEFYNEESFWFSSHKGYPFVAMMMINNEDGQVEQYQIEVVSDTGADGNGYDINYSGDFVQYENNNDYDGHDYHIAYKTHQVYGASDPTICEVFFTVASESAWGSNHYENGFEFHLDTSQSSSTGMLDNKATLSGFPQHTAFGYFLLSRQNGQQIFENEVRNAVQEMANTIAGPGFGKDYPFPLLPAPTTTTPGQTTTPSYTSSTQAPPMANTVSSYAIQQLFNNRFELRSNIPGYFVYNSADNDLYSISDGGNDMFDGGNFVEISDGSNDREQIKYGESYQFNYGDAASVASSPFHMAIWIDNSDYNNEYDYIFRVHGNPGSDGYGQIAVFSGEVQLGNGYQANYVSYQVHSADDASIIELYYGISNVNMWGSSDLWESNTGFTDMWGNFTFSQDGLNDLDSTLRLAAQTRRTLAMYSLLSKENGDPMSQNEVENFIRQAAHVITDDFPYPPFPTASTTTSYTSTTEATSTTAAPPMEDTVSAKVVRELLNNQQQLRSTVADFFMYDPTDNDMYSIQDGGDDMYDTGNMLEVSNDYGDMEQIKYGESYQFDHTDAASVASAPFHGVVWIDNSDGNNMNEYKFRVYGNAGADGNGQIAVYESELNMGNGYQVNYVAFQIYGANDPSIVEVYYAISNSELWGSSDLWSTETNVQNSWGTFTLDQSRNNLDSVLTLVPQTQRTLTVYSLLSRQNGYKMEQQEVENFLRQAAQIIIDGNFVEQPTPVDPVDLTDLHCQDYYGHDDRCNRRKAYLCDYAQWRVNFFAVWLNDFHNFRQQQQNGGDDFEMPECTVPEHDIHCMHESMKVCHNTPIDGCRVCYCSDHEYHNLSQLDNMWRRDYMYWSRWQSRWQEAMSNINGNDFCGFF